MNPKIEKLEKEIDRTKAKIAEMQAKLRKLEEQKTELENTDAPGTCRFPEIAAGRFPYGGAAAGTGGNE